MEKSKTYIATAPGATIKEQLDNRGMSQKEFAIRMDMSQKHISKLINGEVQLTTDVANRLEMVLGLPAKFWCNLETIYREKLFLVQEENAMAEDTEIAKNYPYSEMVKNGWIPQFSKNSEKVRNLRKYFEVCKLSLLKDNEFELQVVCRKLSHTQKSDVGLIVWVQKARIESRLIQTESINIKALKESSQKIREMTMLKPAVFFEPLKKLFASCGVALVILPHIKGSGIHGATFTDCNKIVLGVTVRCKDADRFWFSLFHEIGHIVLGHIGKKSEITANEEKEADFFAQNTLISETDYKSFIKKRNFTPKSIISFAQNIKIDKGIVLGRLQRDGFVEYNSLNELKSQYEITQTFTSLFMAN